MSDTDGKKPLGLGGGPRSGSVKQSFSHGRTHAVVVETKRKRVVVPAQAKPGAAVGGAGASHLGDPSKRPAGITDAEMQRRLDALRLAKARDRRWRNLQAKRREDGQAQMPARTVAKILRCLLQGFDAPLQFAHLLEKHMRLFRGNQPSFHDTKQGEADLRLGMAQHLADRWLGNMQGARGTADGSCLIDGVEDFDVAQFHHTPATYTAPFPTPYAKRQR